jgi:hypothetical protein
VVSLEDKGMGLTNTDNTSTNTSSNRSKRPTVNVYDTKNKLVCGTARKYQLAANEKVLFSLSDSSSGRDTYLVTSNYGLIHFREKVTYVCVFASVSVANAVSVIYQSKVTIETQYAFTSQHNAFISRRNAFIIAMPSHLNAGHSTQNGGLARPVLPSPLFHRDHVGGRGAVRSGGDYEAVQGNEGFRSTSCCVCCAILFIFAHYVV